jgi:hypothetical protein
MAVFRRRDGRPAPVGRSVSGGRRHPSFLPREECAGRGPRTACRAGWRSQGKRSAEPLRGQGRPGARPAIQRGRLSRLWAQSPRRDRRGSALRRSTLASGDPPVARANKATTGSTTVFAPARKAPAGDKRRREGARFGLVDGAGDSPASTDTEDRDSGSGLCFTSAYRRRCWNSRGQIFEESYNTRRLDALRRHCQRLVRIKARVIV